MHSLRAESLLSLPSPCPLLHERRHFIPLAAQNKKEGRFGFTQRQSDERGAMSSLSVTYISGTTLAHFLSAAYACESGRKCVYQLYGLYHNIREVSDGEELRETRGVVLVGAAPLGPCTAPPEVQCVGRLTICRAPSHKLSNADTRYLQKNVDSRAAAAPQVLMHVTCEAKGGEILRALYSVYEVGITPVAPLPLRVDNLVDSLAGFTRVSSLFARNALSPSAQSVETKRAAAQAEHAVQPGTEAVLDALSREKAELVQRTLALRQSLRGQEQRGHV